MLVVKRAFATLTASALLFVGVAAQLAANVCGVKVGPVAVLATQVDRSGAPATVCTTGDQAVRLVQN
jgi:hypothetical protein